MPESILPPKSNTVFQLLFGDPRNIELLADFLKAVIDIPDDEFRDIVIVNPNLTREYPEKKLGVVDLRVTTNFGRIIHIEIQRFPFPEMRDRLIFYDANLIAGQINTGEKYKAIKRVISILITGYTLIPESPRYHHRFTLYDPRAKVEFTDILEIRALELTKIPENPDVYLWYWLRFFNAETKEELDMIAHASPAIQKATARVLELSNDERARLIHEYEARARDYELVKLHYARTEGLEKGRTEGRTEERIAIARNLLQKNMAVADIADITGFSHAEIDEIKKLAH
jgi:predicted transposase/invertase (TIGR01784 family)